jgi:hypothetical protein
MKVRTTTRTLAGGRMDRDYTAEDIDEILDRVRRIETILHKLCLHMDMDPRTGASISNGNKTD